MRHGYAVLAVWVLLDQLGMPVPVVPVLLAAGALAGGGDLDLASTIGIVAAMAVVADVTWYGIGRARGMSVLRLLCRLSLEPDSCVRSTESVFERHGPRALLVAKFVPGLQTVASPLAGVFRLPMPRFLLWEVPGALLWATVYVGLGAVFHEEIEWLFARSGLVGRGFAAAAALALGAYWCWKIAQRRRFVRALRVARIAPEELDRLVRDGDPVQIVDLRRAIDHAADPRTIPGALAIGVEEIPVRHGEIARDRDIVLFCT